MEPIETLADDLLTLHGRIRRTVLAGKTDEVTASQTVALGRLLRHGESTVADLARAEGVRPQSMGATVQALVDLGLVERRPDPADGRRTLVRATETGSRARADAWTNRSRVLTDRLAALPEDDRATVARALAILLPLTDD
ncbi:MarR family winged helix-turn-helix transcriptional regulator [Curtobacterium sp. TXMA1]|uniref:MarR family winged helix-turn-helix transcriptional regulator n=1 Tax=Curtobacterium sp. TXMA1 TaxID=2876939 RepID=UPI001CCF9264|nr:MarR family winged helix-turn-helix transcriptional regulator [Curtobacterium sp. TXMA1]UBQ02236.1 MarR family winged helix-turn-helix transcriptional regulator [Curtobacterium sp. TXMA1]